VSTFANTKHGRGGTVLELATVLSFLNPAGGILIWQAASRLFQKQQLLWQPTLAM